MLFLKIFLYVFNYPILVQYIKQKADSIRFFAEVIMNSRWECGERNVLYKFINTLDRNLYYQKYPLSYKISTI